jgi:hypothetical protein
MIQFLGLSGALTKHLDRIGGMLFLERRVGILLIEEKKAN